MGKGGEEIKKEKKRGSGEIGRRKKEREREKNKLS
jgi:hypothetical protein